MTKETIPDAYQLLQKFLREDTHYLASSSAYGDRGDGALQNALRLFVERPELGFVWLALDGAVPLAVCVISLAISTSAGALVAKLDDVFVMSDRQRSGIGTALLDGLKRELRDLGARRIDTSVHVNNPEAKSFYGKHGFFALHEERLACTL
jgi:GNAT superfamily N-acetyltransferase